MPSARPYGRALFCCLPPGPLCIFMRCSVYIPFSRDIHFFQWNPSNSSRFIRFSEFNSDGSAAEATKMLPAEATKMLPAEAVAPQTVHAPGWRLLLPKSKKTLPDFWVEPRKLLRRSAFQAVSRQSKGLDAVILLQFLPYK